MIYQLIWMYKEEGKVESNRNPLPWRGEREKQSERLLFAENKPAIVAFINDDVVALHKIFLQYL